VCVAYMRVVVVNSFLEKCDVMKEVLQQYLEFIVSKLMINLIC